MARTRVSTTVDECLLAEARQVTDAPSDAALTTTIRNLPSEVVLEPGSDPVPKLSAVNLDSVGSVSLGVLVERLGRLGDERMRAVCDALSVAVACR